MHLQDWPQAKPEQLDVELVEVAALDDQSDCAAQGTLIVVLTIDLDQTLLEDGISRELIRAIRVFRKERDLPYAERIPRRIGSDSPEALAVAEKYGEISNGRIAHEPPRLEGRFAA